MFRRSGSPQTGFASRNALIVVAVMATLGVGLYAAGVVLSDSAQHVASRAASAVVLGETTCYKSSCGYDVVYAAGGTLEHVTITAGEDEPGVDSTTTIYYQVAHPDIARFPDSGYPVPAADDVMGVAGSFLLIITLIAVAAAVWRWITRRRGRGASR
jgi:hypothetical protein